MKFAKEILAKLPDQTQDTVIAWLIRTGLLFRVPVFKMLLRSFEFYGADPAELRNALSRAQDGGPSLVDSLRALGGEMAHLARIVHEAGNLDVARDLYFRASIYYLAADWFVQDRQASVWNYALAMPCFDRFRMFSTPPIEKVEFQYPAGTLTAHFRVPTGREGPFPAVVILQGNDTVKEWMVAYEELALARGMAILTIDQPGWGESGLSGNKCISSQDLQNCACLALDFLQGRSEIRGDAIGVFGVSLGGFLAPYCAGLEPRFAAVAGLGGPYYVREAWRKMPAIHRRRAYRHTGLTTLQELDEWVEQLDISKNLARVHCPALIVHGSKDEIVTPDNARALAAAMSGETQVKIVEGGDHMCTQFLFAWVADYVFDWFAERLNRKPERLSIGEDERLPELGAASFSQTLMAFGH